MPRLLIGVRPLLVTVIFGVIWLLHVASTSEVRSLNWSDGNESTPSLKACATFLFPSSWIKPTKAISSFFRVYEGTGQLSVKVRDCPDNHAFPIGVPA